MRDGCGGVGRIEPTSAYGWYGSPTRGLNGRGLLARAASSEIVRWYKKVMFCVLRGQISFCKINVLYDHLDCTLIVF